jgi:hypothetical protein
MRPELVLLAVVLASLFTSDVALERPPVRHLAAVVVRAPAATDADVTAPFDPDVCDRPARPMLLSNGSGLDLLWQWKHSDGAPNPTLDPACAQQIRVVSP